MEIFKLTEYGPIGIILLSILLAVKLILDHFKTRDHNKSMENKLDVLIKKQTAMEGQLSEMYKWHDVSDPDGVKIWYRKSSFDERMLTALDKLAVAIDGLIELQREHAFKIESLKEKVDAQKKFL